MLVSIDSVQTEEMCNLHHLWWRQHVSHVVFVCWFAGDPWCANLCLVEFDVVYFSNISCEAMFCLLSRQDGVKRSGLNLHPGPLLDFHLSPLTQKPTRHNSLWIQKSHLAVNSWCHWYQGEYQNHKIECSIFFSLCKTTFPLCHFRHLPRKRLLVFPLAQYHQCCTCVPGFHRCTLMWVRQSGFQARSGHRENRDNFPVGHESRFIDHPALSMVSFFLSLSLSLSIALALLHGNS